MLQLAGRHNDFAVQRGFFRNTHRCRLLYELNFFQQRTPELCFFCVRVPCVNVLLHHSAEIGQLREIKALLNGGFKRLP